MVCSPASFLIAFAWTDSEMSVYSLREQILSRGYMKPRQPDGTRSWPWYCRSAEHRSVANTTGLRPDGMNRNVTGKESGHLYFSVATAKY